METLARNGFIRFPEARFCYVIGTKYSRMDQVKFVEDDL